MSHFSETNTATCSMKMSVKGLNIWVRDFPEYTNINTLRISLVVKTYLILVPI